MSSLVEDISSVTKNSIIYPYLSHSYAVMVPIDTNGSWGRLCQSGLQGK